VTTDCTTSDGTTSDGTTTDGATPDEPEGGPMKFLLIHGGWQGGWCWDGVVAELERRGHEAHAPTLPGLEPDAADRSGVGLATFMAHAARELDARDLSDVVVVGHSGGGPVAQGVVEKARDRVRRIVFVDAWVLRDGERIFDVTGPEMEQGFTTAAAASADGTVPMAEEFWVHGLCNDLSEDAARGWMSRVVPCPIGWLSEPAVLPGFATSGVASAYVFLDDDVTVDPSIYRQMAERLDAPRTTTCPGAHEAMLSQPVALAEALLRVAGNGADGE
jgi:pimeloyl-ACP methyl ester carboxylesterase